MSYNAYPPPPGQGYSPQPYAPGYQNPYKPPNPPGEDHTGRTILIILGIVGGLFLLGVLFFMLVAGTLILAARGRASSSPSRGGPVTTFPVQGEIDEQLSRDPFEESRNQFDRDIHRRDAEFKRMQEDMQRDQDEAMRRHKELLNEMRERREDRSFGGPGFRDDSGFGGGPSTRPGFPR